MKMIFALAVMLAFLCGTQATGLTQTQQAAFKKVCKGYDGVDCAKAETALDTALKVPQNKLQDYSTWENFMDEMGFHVHGFDETNPHFSLFYSNGGNKKIPIFLISLAKTDGSLWTSRNINPGHFGNNYGQLDSDLRSLALDYWDAYSEWMAKETQGIALWLSGSAGGDGGIFPPRRTLGAKTVWQKHELPNLSHNHVSKVIVLSFPADTPTKKCNNDHDGYRRLLAANSNIREYICCDLPHAKDSATYESDNPTGAKMVEKLQPVIHAIVQKASANQLHASCVDLKTQFGSDL